MGLIRGVQGLAGDSTEGLRTRRSRTALAVLAFLVLGTLAGPSGVAIANDLRTEASGPILNRTVYQGTTKTSNDVDWWVFYTGGTTQLDIMLLGLGPEDCFGPLMNFTDANGAIIEQSSNVNRNEIEHILYTVGAGTFYVEVRPNNVAPCAGSDAVYRLGINASSALLTAPPRIPPPAPPSSSPGGVSRGCQQARARVASLSTRLRQATGRRQRNRLRARLRNARSRASSRC